MDRRVLVAAIAALMMTTTVDSAGAQCSFEHPRSFPLGRHARNFNRYLAGLVPAFVSCNNPGGNTPNGTTETGVVPSCAPPETYHQQSLNPPFGWMWDEGEAQGEISLFPTRNFIPHPLNQSSNIADVAVKLRLRGIIDANGPANSVGSVQLVLRITMDDRASGDMTLIDFPVGFGFSLSNGNATKRTTLNTILNNLSQPGLPGCAVVEVVSALVYDPNGNRFATTGMFIPAQ